MDSIVKKFDLLKQRVNEEKLYLDIGCSFVGKKLEGVFLLFEKYDASEIEMATFLEMLREFVDFGFMEHALLKAINNIRQLFSVGWMQIFAFDILNKNKFKIYFFEKNRHSSLDDHINVLQRNFNYGEVNYDPICFQDEFLCFGFTIDLSKEHFLENYKVYYKAESNEPTEPYIQMFSAKKFSGFERYNYYLCQNGFSFYKFIRNTYGIDTFKDLPNITNNYSLSEIQISENPLSNKKINLYYFDTVNDIN